MQHGRQECRPSDGTATLLSPMAVTKRYYGSPSGSAPDGIVTSESLYPRAAHAASPVKKPRFLECVVLPFGGRFDGFRLKAALRTRSSFRGPPPKKQVLAPTPKNSCCFL